MRSLGLLDGLGPRPTVLFLGAHSDDIEIGCGATVLQLVEACPQARIHWIVFSADEERAIEARASAEAFLDGSTEVSIEVHSFRESYFPYVADEVKDTFEDIKGRVEPDVVFTHCIEDRHQDHRLVSELTRNTFRNHLTLEYEIPKYDGDLIPTNVFMPVGRDHLARKIDLLMEHFGSQRSRSWFDPETFRGLARIRGVECNAPEGYAEGYRGHKVVLSV